MKVILFGGAEVSLGQVVPEIRLMGTVIQQTGAKQVLHIPYARIAVSEDEWSGDWFGRNIHIDGREYLNANNEEDIEKAQSPLIFISGGHEHANLIEKIQANPRLLELIKNAEIVIGESAGSMALGEYFRSARIDGSRTILKGLGIIKDTLIMPHYTERKLQDALTDAMKQSGVRYGIGIDAMTAIEFNLDEFPEKYTTIGLGSVTLKIA